MSHYHRQPTTFGCLPAELRLKIWALVASEPRGVALRLDTRLGIVTTWSHTAPVLLAICRESRYEALKVYIDIGSISQVPRFCCISETWETHTLARPGLPIYINPSIDMLYWHEITINIMPSRNQSYYNYAETSMIRLVQCLGNKASQIQHLMVNNKKSSRWVPYNARPFGRRELPWSTHWGISMALDFEHHFQNLKSLTFCNYSWEIVMSYSEDEFYTCKVGEFGRDFKLDLMWSRKKKMRKLSGKSLKKAERRASVQPEKAMFSQNDALVKDSMETMGNVDSENLHIPEISDRTDDFGKNMESLTLRQRNG